MPANDDNDLPALRLEWRTPAELAENPANWRRHPPEQLAALTGVIAEVGWAGACLFNETTGRLIDGHARRTVAIEQGAEKVPVLVGRWTEEQERKILASLDPLSAMAEADPVALAELLVTLDTESAELQAMLDAMAEGSGIFGASEVDSPDLPSGDRSPFQQMTFTLSDEQAEQVKNAMKAAADAGPFADTGNENSNGNALARIAEMYLGKS